MRNQVLLTKRTELALKINMLLSRLWIKLKKTSKVAVNPKMYQLLCYLWYPVYKKVYYYILLSNIALHGVVIIGFLVWADIQRHTTENIWKAQAMKHFTNQEIANAKEIIWDVAAKSILGKIIKLGAYIINWWYHQ